MASCPFSPCFVILNNSEPTQKQHGRQLSHIFWFPKKLHLWKVSRGRWRRRALLGTSIGRFEQVYVCKKKMGWNFNDPRREIARLQQQKCKKNIVEYRWQDEEHNKWSCFNCLCLYREFLQVVCRMSKCKYANVHREKYFQLSIYEQNVTIC